MFSKNVHVFSYKNIVFRKMPKKFFWRSGSFPHKSARLTNYPHRPTGGKDFSSFAKTKKNKKKKKEIKEAGAHGRGRKSRRFYVLLLILVGKNTKILRKIMPRLSTHLGRRSGKKSIKFLRQRERIPSHYWRFLVYNRIIRPARTVYYTVHIILATRFPLTNNAPEGGGGVDLCASEKYFYSNFLFQHPFCFCVFFFDFFPVYYLFILKKRFGIIIRFPDSFRGIDVTTSGYPRFLSDGAGICVFLRNLLLAIRVPYKNSFISVI